MKSRRSRILAGLICVIGLALPVSTVLAEEPIVPFVDALRARGFYDTADEYLSGLEADPKTPADIKKTIPYHRAVTLIDSAYQQKVPETQILQFERAAALLEKFLKDNPTHPMRADAETRRGNIFLGKARSLAMQANSPANTARKSELQNEAKQNIETARTIFKAAHDSHEKRWKSFPTYIPPEETEKIAARRKAEVDYMVAQRDLAMTTYEEAQIYGKKDPKYRKLLTDAAKEFEAIHTRYRSQIVGLMCRMWQGKCFEEQDDLGRALGIYGELLEHQGKQPQLIRLQHQVLHFKLICLNHPQRNDHELVIRFATEWLNKNAQLARTRDGLGIRYELAVAREKRAEQIAKNPKHKPSEVSTLLQAAQADAQFVNRFAGKYKDVTTMMVLRLKRARGIATEDPKTFPDAFSAARVTLNNFEKSREAYATAVAANKPKDEIQGLETKLKNDLEETARLYRLTLTLATEKSDSKQLNEARYLLGYIYLREAQYLKSRDRLFDAAVLSEFAARQLKEQDPQTANKSAFQAMSALIPLYNAAPQGAQQAEIAWIIRIARFLTTNWPSSEFAAEANFHLGDLYERKQQHLISARWFAKVPPTSQKFYADALASAGLRYWSHYSTAASIPLDRKSITDAMTANIGEDFPLAVADLMNPTWQMARRAEQLIELEVPLTIFSADSKAAPKQTPGGKKQPAGGGAQKQLQDLQKRSVAELQAALAKVANQPAANLQGFSEAELRTRLLKELQLQSEAKLRSEFAALLGALDDASLKKLYQDKIEIWQTAAAWYLRKSIEQIQSQLTSTSATPDTLLRAKIFFAEYLLNNGDYKTALAMLTQAPHDVVTAIKVDDNSKRPNDSSPKGRIFAGVVYQLLAKSYIGVRDTAKFRETMAAMEEIAGKDDAESLNEIYKKIGRDTQKQIEQLMNRNQPERLKEELDNFSSITKSLMSRSQEYNTLMWVAETAYGLGEGLKTDAAAPAYFEQAAAAYQKILDSGKLTADQKIGVQLRQINCKRRQSQYEDALALAKEVVKAKPIMLAAHFEAAMTLQDWADSGKPEKYLEAVNGSKDPVLWGWFGIGEKLRQTLMQNRNRSVAEQLPPEKVKEYDQKYLQARYYLSQCRLKYGEALSAQPTDPKRTQALGNGLRELKAFVRTVGVIDGRQFEDVKTRNLVDARTRFDELNATMYLAMGKDAGQVVPLSWPEPQPDLPIAKTKIPTKTDIARVSTSTSGDADAEAGSTEESGSNPLFMIFGILFAIVAFGGGGWFLFKAMGKPQKRRLAYGSFSAGGANAETISIPDFDAPKPKAARKPRPAGQQPPAQSKQPPTKPQQRPAAKPPAGAPKKRSERPPSKPG